KGATFYVGFDPTADSLHIGHFIQLMVMTHLQRAGMRPIALMGGGTGHIGDPSGRSDMRSLMSKETIDHNVDCFVKQMSRLLDFSDGKAIIDNNADWLLELNYIDFLREIGVHFSVNRMLSLDSYKNRLEEGLSFFEFNYILLQAYDFLHLYRKYDCRLQVGGSDQWSNIIAGVDLIRKVEHADAYGMTFSLLTNSAGEKMGKTAKGAVWLDEDKFSVYDFYQYLRNVNDADVIKFMKQLTFMPMEEIEEYSKMSGADLNKAKERLAFEVTSLVHGQEKASGAEAAAKALFGGQGDLSDSPTYVLKSSEMDKSLIEILADNKIVTSRSEARRLLQQGGLYLNDEAVGDIGRMLKPQDLDQDASCIIRLGKKRYYILRFED
ncbi:MAG: tyrosine--tRNA ligase, partial [Eubacteriales bacterium]|nr:tyrosine--tRNA ligase [Eubacteriales bacterium]